MCVNTSVQQYRLIITASDKSQLKKDFTFNTVVVTTVYGMVKTPSSRFYPKFANNWRLHCKLFEGQGNPDLIKNSPY